MKTRPAVYAVHDTYQIMVQTTEETMMWVRVGEKEYYDEVNGILRSKTEIHRMIVPAAELDAAGSYTVCERKLIKRQAYFSETKEVEETVIPFYPVKGGELKCYHIADAHNLEEEPIGAALAFGKIDFLIMNGDIPDSSDKLEYYDSIYRIAAEITRGEIPVVFARGNHDLRGKYAERIADYIPHENGNTYFTFRLGNVWGMVLDCGEDKDDSHPEYGYTVCCHNFRLRQTEFIKKVIAEQEYLEEGIEWRIIVAHNPFTLPKPEVFYIEKDIFAEWAALIRENIKPDAMITGHNHELRVVKPGEEDELGHPCPVIIASLPMREEKRFIGGGIGFEKERIRVTFSDNYGKVLEEHFLEKQVGLCQ